jgi:hypothetical protein
MSGFGWLVPSISWPMVAFVLVYNVIWALAMSGIRVAVEQLTDHMTPLRRKHIALMARDVRAGTGTRG